MSQHRPIRAWGLTHKKGGCRGWLMPAQYVPDWHPLKMALFATRNDAARYIMNTKQEHILEPIKLTINIEKHEVDPWKLK